MAKKDDIYLATLYLLSGGGALLLETVRERYEEYGVIVHFESGQTTTLGLKPATLRTYLYRDWCSNFSWRRICRKQCRITWKRKGHVAFGHLIRERTDLRAMLAALRKYRRKLAASSLPI